MPTGKATGAALPGAMMRCKRRVVSGTIAVATYKIFTLFF